MGTLETYGDYPGHVRKTIAYNAVVLHLGRTALVGLGVAGVPSPLWWDWTIDTTGAELWHELETYEY